MEFTFYPPRRNGLILHAGLSVILLLIATFSFDGATRVEVGQPFLVYLVLFLGSAVPLPLILYRLYGLLRAVYILDSDSVRLRWGVRSEQIPLSRISWISLASDLGVSVPLPRFRFPGAVVGGRHMRNYGDLEFLATREHGLVLIAVDQVTYVVSPEDPEAFLSAFRGVTELGSVNPVAGTSYYPGALFGTVWRSLPARVLLIAGLVCSLAVLIYGGAALPGTPAVYVATIGDVKRRLSTSQLILLPILNAIFFMTDLLLGIFFYRNPLTQTLAYLLWGSSLFSSILIFLAMFLALSGV